MEKPVTGKDGSMLLSLGDIAETEATINDSWIFTKFRKR